MEILNNILLLLFSRTPGSMSFTSVQFIVFFTLLAVLYAVLPPKHKVRTWLLLVFSLYYYYRLSGPGLLVLAGISLSDFLLARWMHNAASDNRKKHLMLLSLFIDIGALGYFKYANFFMGQYQSVFHPADIFVPLSIIIPVGISYFIFKSLGYVLDVYRGIIEEPERDFSVYLLYTSFFPTILAGPISRAREFLPQLHANAPVSESMASRGFYLILAGVIKKIVIADFIAANFLDRVLETPTYFSGFEHLMALFAAPMQVYADFSGYTDMALGFALLFGFELKDNFNFPFRARTVTEFWRRWHITLLDWFNEYVFSPLSLALRSHGKAAVIVAITVTFLISGFWHGAAWTFIVWGLLHATMLIFEYLSTGWREKGMKKNQHTARRFLWAVVSFIFIAATFIVFQSSSLENAWTVFDKILDGFDEDIISDWLTNYFGVFIVMVAGYVLHFLPEAWRRRVSTKFNRLHWAVQALIIAVGFYLVYQIVTTDTKPFLYLEF